MNRGEFEVWKKEREHKYTDDLRDLRNDLASRGMTYSGLRGREEQRLKQKFDYDVEFERIQMENTEKEKHRWFPDGNWRPFLLSTIISILIGVIVFYLTRLK